MSRTPEQIRADRASREAAIVEQVRQQVATKRHTFADILERRDLPASRRLDGTSRRTPKA